MLNSLIIVAVAIVVFYFAVGGLKGGFQEDKVRAESLIGCSLLGKEYIIAEGVGYRRRSR